jgi:CubicO group peptidase (beta-lactamase class C family)
VAGAIVTKNSLLAVGAAGTRVYGYNVPVTLNDKFHIGSDTKMMTATLVGMLLDEGRLTLDTTLGQIFPAGSLQGGLSMNAGWNNVTVRQAMQMRGGFVGSRPSFWDPIAAYNASPNDLRPQLESFLVAQLNQTPPSGIGTYQYANSAFITMGAIAQRMWNQQWEDAITQRLFQPLGMTSAGIGDPATAGLPPDQADQPWAHTRSGTTNTPVVPRPDHLDLMYPYLGPAGRVHVTMYDWARFGATMLRGEQGIDGLLDASTIQDLHLQSTSGGGQSYGGGWMYGGIDGQLGRYFWHNGSNGGNYSFIAFYPDHDVAFMAATNVYGGSDNPAAVADTSIGKLKQLYWTIIPEPGSLSLLVLAVVLIARRLRA